MEEQTATDPPYHLALPEWPGLEFGNPEVDGLIPACRIRNWRRFESALGKKEMNSPGTELIFRGQRRYEWQLTPTLGRYSASGAVDERRALEQKREFRLAMRGRGIGPELLDEDNELWAFGQHHGLATPLLDWTKSPFVALFFAFADPDFSYEDPNPSRAIFVINKTALEELDETLIVQPLRNDHTRLVNQAGLFTLSPLGSDTLATRILNLLSDSQTVDMDSPEEVGRFIFKIHVPNEERRECLSMLRKMNIHHGSLFPDPIGASLYCNEWFGGRVDELPVVPEKAPRPIVPKPKPKARTKAPAAKMAKALTASLTDGVAQVLRSAGIKHVLVPDLAKSLATKFNSTAAIDWSGRTFGSAAVHVDIKRILRMNGVSTEDVEPVAQAVFDFFVDEAKRSQSEASPGDAA